MHHFDSFCQEVKVSGTLVYIIILFILIMKVTYQTEMGQTLDLLTSPDDNVDFSRFSIERYQCEY